MLPDAAILGFYAPGAALSPWISGAEVNASVQRNLAAGASDEVGEIDWSPLVEGEAVTFEIDLPAGVHPDEVRIDLPWLSHLFRWPFDDASDGTDCQEDVSCHPDWDRQSRATVLLLYTDRLGGTGVCSGTLLNDADPASYLPYVLTAHHCVSDQVRLRERKGCREQAIRDGKGGSPQPEVPTSGCQAS